ncbi:TPA: type II methionyl aminopeptidase [Candidatus Woesearchaeota archaeon]|nr:type II methionyl aminopeptidase [Candidatus Woesearchaeota archaeon]
MHRDIELVPDKDALLSYRKAGRVASQALAHGAKQVKPGVSMREVLDSVEELIIKRGCGIAFPAQSSVNKIAAHFCPTDTDDIIYDDGMVIKIDVGAHHDGYIGDNAVTIDLGGQHQDLIHAARDALAAMERTLKPGCTQNDVGNAINNAITAHGMLPIRNLSGHGVARFQIHTEPSMPNFPTNERFALVENQVVAVEPFATNGTAGLIYNGSNPTVFTLGAIRPLRTQYGRDTLSLAQKYNGLPFTTRWLTRKLGSKALLGLADLRRAGMLNEYPPLPEKSGGLVAQFENTFLITKDGCKVLTRDDD